MTKWNVKLNNTWGNITRTGCNQYRLYDLNYLWISAIQYHWEMLLRELRYIVWKHSSLPLAQTMPEWYSHYCSGTMSRENTNLGQIWKFLRKRATNLK